MEACCLTKTSLFRVMNSLQFKPSTTSLRSLSMPIHSVKLVEVNGKIGGTCIEISTRDIDFVKVNGELELPILNQQVVELGIPRACHVSKGEGKRFRRAYDGLLLDAAGTLLQLSEPVGEVYASIGRKYGLSISPDDIMKGFKRAFAAPWPEKLRYQGDGRPFWRHLVSKATGCDDDDYFEEVYEHYGSGDAWHLPDGAQETLYNLKNVGVKVALVSNFDSRLRKLLKDLNVIDMFDALIISAEIGYEKPDPKIFLAALEQLRVDASKAVHVGDDKRADKGGASAIGIDCWLWGKDVNSFPDIQNRILISER